MGAQSFRRHLSMLLAQRGWTIPMLAKVSGYSRGYLWELVTGKGNKQPGPDLIVDVDHALGAGGALILAWEDGDNDVDRRDVLRDLGGLALVGSLATAESVRQDITATLTGRPSADEWERIVGEYARAFYLTPAHILLRDLLADLALLDKQIRAAPSSAQTPLRRAAGQLAAITAMTWSGLGQQHQAARWWHTARAAADTSGDTAARVWVRGWEVANGLYERRPITLILDRAAQTIALAGDRADAGTAGMLAGLAQTQAVAAHPDAATTLAHVAQISERVDAVEAADTNSMLGWPEVRLRHTESYVYTMLGDTKRAYTAQDQALALYGHDLARERAAMLLHRAHCMITDGDVTGGVTFAHDVLDQLPPEHHTELVYAIAYDTLAAVPPPDRTSPAVASLRERLTHPAGQP